MLRQWSDGFALVVWASILAVSLSDQSPFTGIVPVGWDGANVDIAPH